jgi:type II secretory pathway component PulF
LPQQTQPKSGQNPHGYAALFTWLQIMGNDAAWRLYLALRGTDYQSLAEFSRNFGGCMKTVADVESALKLCIRPMRNTPIGQRWSSAVDTIQQGGTLAEALKPASDFLPDFYLPLVTAGEQSGRLAEVFHFLHEHCKALSGPLASLRHTWLFPLAIFVAGSLLRVLVCLFGGSVLLAIQITIGEVLDLALLTLMLGLVMLTPARYFVDQMRLSLPLISDLEREIATYRFFRVMSMLYSVGEHRVESMIQLAADTVSNRAAQLDLRKAALAIEDQSTITEAFRKVRFLTSQTQATIESAEISGTLENGFLQISDEAGAAMVAKLKFIQPILVRIVMGLVIVSTLITMLEIVF